MSKMGTSFRKGRKQRKILLLSLVLAVLMAVSGITAALAASSSNTPAFSVYIGGRTRYVQDAQLTLSLGDKVNFKNQQVFTAGKLFNKVQRIIIQSSDIVPAELSGTSDKQLELVMTEESKKKWQDKSDRQGINLIYTSTDGINRSDFDTLMSQLTVQVKNNALIEDGGVSAKISINAQCQERYALGGYYWKAITTKLPVRNDSESISKNKNVSTFTTRLVFYNYAEGEYKPNTSKMDYKTEYAGYDSKYDDVIRPNTDNSALISPENKNGGKATFQIRLTQKNDKAFTVASPGSNGEKSFGKQAQIYYQVKEYGASWGGPSTYKEVGTIADLPGFSLAETNAPIGTGGYLVSNPINVTVPNLDAETRWVVRGIIVTDGRTSAARYTDEIVFQYKKPSISSFNVGNTSKYYLGGSDNISLSLLANFNDVNAMGVQNYTGIDDNKHTGPTVKADVYFTTNRNFTTENRNGKTVQVDHSKWLKTSAYNIPATSMVDDQGNLITNLTKPWSIPAPTTVGALLGTTNSTVIDSTNCAFKVVVTDLYTGYTEVAYTDPFKIDSTKPTGLQIVGYNGSGQQVSLGQSEGRTVGGAGAQIKIDMKGATDTSGIKQYEYSMYYLATGDADPSLTKTAQVLNAMAAYNSSATGHGKSEYTDWTIAAAKPGSTSGEKQLIVSKDGYYRIDVRAVDNAGRTSDIQKAYFRVDLSVPAAPKATLVKASGSSFTAYDNTSYTNSTVWIFAYSEEKTGKYLSDMEFSTDGGLSWKSMTGITTSANRKFTKATQDGVNSLVTLNNISAAGKYQAGANLTGEGYGDYVSIMVRAKDTLGNVSNPSSPVVMRTITDAPQPTSVLNHSGIEVALAIGNTEMMTTYLTQDLKNKSAYKINEKYYGTSGSTNMNASDFNPWKYLLTQSHSASGRPGWKCTWGNDTACVGACKDANCPYKKLIDKGYELFTPEMVNVQGMKGADVNGNDQFSWVRYDHTMYNKYATAGYTGTNTDNGSGTYSAKPTNMQGNAINSKDGLYISSKDRVISLAQTTPATRVSSSGLNQISAGEETGARDQQSYLDHYGHYHSYCIGNYGDVQSWNNGGTYTNDLDNSPSKTYIWRTDRNQIRRIYHIMDLAYQSGSDADGTWYNTNNRAGQKAMSTIGNAGYTNSAFRDWLFLYNDQPAKKTIFFTADDSILVPHASDGYGFLFNTTIRQSKAGRTASDGSVSDGSWRISGYLFYIGNPWLDRYNHSALGTSYDHTENTRGYRWYVLKLDDVNLEHFADGVIRGAAGAGTAGYGKKNAKKGTARSYEDGNFGQIRTDGERGEYHDDLAKFLMYGGDKTEGVNGNYWISSSQAAGTTQLSYSGNNAPGINYGIEQVAMYIDPSYDQATPENRIRNFVIVTEGKQTKIYAYDSGKCGESGSKKTATQLTTLFAQNVTEENPAGTGNVKSGYTLIDWDVQRSDSKVYDEEGVLIDNAILTPRPTVDGLQIGKRDAKLSGIHTDTNCYGFGPLYGARSWSHWCYADTRVSLSNIVMQINLGRKLSEVVTEPSWGAGQSKFIANLSDDSVDDFHDPVLCAQVQWRLAYDSAKFIGWGAEDNRVETMNFLNKIDGEGTYVPSETTDWREIAYSTQVDTAATYITKEYYESLGFNASSSTTIKDQVQAAGAKKGSVYTLDNIAKIDFSVITPGTKNDYAQSSANPDFPSGRWYMLHDTLGYETDVDPLSGQFTDALNLNHITRPGRYTVYFAPSADSISKSKDSKVQPHDNSLNPADAVFDFVVNTTPEAMFTGTVSSSGTVTVQDVAKDGDCPTTGVPNAKNYTYTLNGATKTYNDCNLNGIVKREWRWEITKKQSGDITTIASTGWGTGNNPNGKTLYSLSGGKISALDSNMIMVVYERVTDVTARKVGYKSNNTVAGAGEAVAYFKYEPQTTTSLNVSAVCQQNLSQNVTATFPPTAAFSLTPSIMYNTAQGSNAYLSVTRASSHPQKKNTTCSWQIDPTGSGKFQDMTQSGNNWKYGSTTVLECVTAPTSTNGDGKGEWRISQAAVKAVVGKTTGKSFAIRMVEKLWGKSVEDVALHGSSATESWITDQSARTVYYYADSTPPTAQTVTASSVGSSDGSYEASNYLDVSNGTNCVKLEVGGSKDNEGAVAGYAYYFYTTNSAGVITQYYYMDSSGKLHTATSKDNAINNSGAKKIGGSGGTISIGKNAMISEPTCILNVGVYAYDTAGNKTQETRIEGIKLSVSKPMPPAIYVTDGLNADVVHILNNNGYNGLNNSNDKIIGNTAKNYTANSNVTVNFEPRTSTYKTVNGDLVADANGTKYYQDIYKAADLTGVADIVYTLDYKPTGKTTDTTGWWTESQIRAAGMTKSARITPTENLSFSLDGVYKLTAHVVNGSGTVSTNRSVAFTIDKTAPTNPMVTLMDSNGNPYQSGQWTKSVTMKVYASTDTNSDTARYAYSITGGSEWIDLGPIEEEATYTFQPPVVNGVSTSKSWDVLVRAMDLAGNEQKAININGATDSGGNLVYSSEAITISVDAKPPVTPPLTLEATSKADKFLSDYLITLVGFDESAGYVTSSVGGGEEIRQKKNDIVPVVTGKSVRFYFYPADGRQLGDIIYLASSEGATSQLMNDELNYDSTKGVYFLELLNVREDATLSVAFPESAVKTMAYMARGRAVSYYSMAPHTAAAYNAEAPDDEAGEAGGGAGEGGNAGEGAGEGEGAGGETVMYTVYTDGGKFSEIEPAEAEVEANKTVDIVIKPADNYQLQSLTVAGVAVSLDDVTKDANGSYHYTVTASRPTTLVEAVCAPIPTRTLHLSWNATGDSSDEGANYSRVSLMEGDAVRGDGTKTSETSMDYTVIQGGTIYFQLAPQSGYMIKSMVIDGEEKGPILDTAAPMEYVVQAPKDDAENTDLYVTVEFDVSTETVSRVINVQMGLPGEDGIYGNEDDILGTEDTETDDFHGTITPVGATNVPANGSRTFVIQPDVHYEIADLRLSQTVGGDGETETNSVLGSAKQLPGENVWVYTISKPTNGDLTVYFKQKTYTINAYKNVLDNAAEIGVSRADGGAVFGGRYPEGVDVKIDFNAKKGYKLVNVEITHGQTVIKPGTVTSYILKNLSANVEITATFEPREVSTYETTHTIKATANGVKDEAYELAEKPYRFMISYVDEKGVKHQSDPTSWRAANSIEYTVFQEAGSSETEPLDPNKLYTVYLKTRDSVGNESEWVPNSVYTQANIPSALRADPLDSENNSLTRSVVLTIDAGGNPEPERDRTGKVVSGTGTEYQVRYSLSSDMTNYKIANSTTKTDPTTGEEITDPESGWITQNADGKLEIQGLNPSTLYYLQIVARNHAYGTDPHYVTDVNPNAIVEIMLSPAAPPENSFYFEEQTSPVGGVTLHWDAPSGDVKGVVIYCDNQQVVRTTNNTDTEFTVPATILKGDAVNKYSYAYYNDAGDGSTRYAVSAEYHDAATDKRAEMDQLISDSGYSSLFSESMTYPAFPLTVMAKDYSAVAAGDSTKANNGTLEVKMPYDAEVLGRYQKYFLTLKAFEKVVDPETGDPILDANGKEQYIPITDIDQWDPDGVNQNADGTQKVKETFGRNNQGSIRAWAKWTGLNPKYEYQIFVEKIESIGYETSDNLGGQILGVEGSLGKRYTVTEEGYTFAYSKEDADFLDAPSGVTEWAEGESLTYTKDKGWDAPINDGYIAFNRSPGAAGASAADIYSGNESVNQKTDSALGNYVLVDQTMDDKEFHVKVAIWDPDGARADTVPSIQAWVPNDKGNKGTVYCQITEAQYNDYKTKEPSLTPENQNKTFIGVSGGYWMEWDYARDHVTFTDSAGNALEKEKTLPKTETEAKKRERLFDIVFDASGMYTDAYQTLSLVVNDGDTTTPVEIPINLVVNADKPVVSTQPVQKMEQGRPYSKDSLQISSSAFSVENNLESQKPGISRAALWLMPSQYDAALGSHSYTQLHQWLCEQGNQTAMTKAEAILGADASAYKTGGKLTEAGLYETIIRVKPPVTVYTKITQAQFDSLDAATKANEAFSETGSSETFYWVSMNYALSHPGSGLCTWLTDNGNNTVTATATVYKDDNSVTEREKNTYKLNLVAHFGGNTASQAASIVLKSAPSTSVVSDPKLGWVDTIVPDEYELYRSMTIQEVLNKYKDYYTCTEDLTGINTATTPAAKQTGTAADGRPIGKVFKPSNGVGQIFSNQINGQVDVELGVYEYDEQCGDKNDDESVIYGFAEAGVVLVPVEQTGFNPNNYPNATGFPDYAHSTIIKENGKNEILQSGAHNYEIRSLEADTTYRIWSYYKLPGKQAVYSTQSAVMTTKGEYETAYYGFKERKYSLRERDAKIEDQNLNIAVQKVVSGASGASATLTISAEYLEADEFGNLELENGQPKQLTGAELELARQTFTFKDDPGRLSIDKEMHSDGNIEMVLKDNDGIQSHMIVRLRIAIKNSDVGYCYPLPGSEYTDIFVKDDEDHVTDFILRLDNSDGTLGEVTSEGRLSYYTYAYPGLKLGYTSIGRPLKLTYYNDGTGDLNNITAAVYADEFGNTRSNAFTVSTPDPSSLQKDLDKTGFVEVKPAANLEDGVYFGWVIFKADNMEKEDWVKVRVYQVVGQSTLKDRIYITPTMPNVNERTGVATISLYSGDTNYDDSTGTYTQAPLYTTKSSMYGGEFEIPNILNEGSLDETGAPENASSGNYRIVVERDGFITYDSVLMGQNSLMLGYNGGTYTFNLRLIGGDVNADQEVREDDRKELIKHYNKYVDLDETTPEDKIILKRCDFNQDGVVNALDRAFVIGNEGSTVMSYSYDKLNPDAAES